LSGFFEGPGARNFSWQIVPSLTQKAPYFCILVSYVCICTFQWHSKTMQTERYTISKGYFHLAIPGGVQHFSFPADRGNVSLDVGHSSYAMMSLWWKRRSCGCLWWPAWGTRRTSANLEKKRMPFIAHWRKTGIIFSLFVSNSFFFFVLLCDVICVLHAKGNYHKLSCVIFLLLCIKLIPGIHNLYFVKLATVVLCFCIGICDKMR